MRQHPEMQPGRMDQRVTIQSKSETTDSGGGASITWSDVATIWAHVEPVRGQERIIADQQRGVQTYRVISRNDGDFADVDSNDRLVWGSLTLNVRTAPNAGRSLYRMIEAEAGVET